MSTGISISSINRIKELAEERKFKEALEILDTQNLEKSINPQFLKISGEVFRENKRYYDCRKILLKAHQMAPQGTRIIQELIQLYLELGYFSKAQKYYEQYMFYVTPEDTQKDYVEYMMKKATGVEVKDLAAILIPILERMPEDRWNFEAILLYDKMDRKDMALEESRYILENFKESEFVQPVIDYIDDKLDIDKCFYVYPKEEQPEDTELFGDLIELEEKILEADHLRMYPPEARIMVEADDNDAMEAAPVKEKKSKKSKGLFKKSAKNAEDIVDGELSDHVAETNEKENDATERISSVDKKEPDSTKEDKLPVEDKSSTEDKSSESSGEITKDDNKLEDEARKDADRSDDSHSVSDDIESEADKRVTDNPSENAADNISAEEQIKQEREVALEKILSKKFDKDKIKESAKQVAKAVKEIDKDKAKEQVKSVASTVKDNVKKATDVIGGAVGTKVATDQIENAVQDKMVPEEEFIMDGIIEGVLEPPKKAIGEVVMNEELDALIPDSLEAMSEKEIADIEAKKEEIERLELEALETTLKLEEEKKAKRQARMKLGSKETDETATDSDEVSATVEDVTAEQIDTVKASDEEKSSELKTDENKDMSSESKSEGDEQQSEAKKDAISIESTFDQSADDNDVQEEATFTSDGSSYAELKSRFIKDMEDVKPLESLGFMTVVHSDVDSTMEEAIPDAAGMLRQMIDNKEFYSGENSLGFESEASYLNHGFEVEDFDFDTYRKQLDDEQEEETVEPNLDVDLTESIEEDMPESPGEETLVEEIYAQESVVAFEEVVEEEPVFVEEVQGPIYEEAIKEASVAEEPVFVEEVQKPIYEEAIEEASVAEEPIFVEEVQGPIYEEAIKEASVAEEPVFVEEVQELIYEEAIKEASVAEEPVFVEEVQEPIYEKIIEEASVAEEPAFVEEVQEPIYEEVIEEASVAEEPVFVEEVQEPIYEEAIEEVSVAEEPVFVEEVQEPIYEEAIEEVSVAEEPVFVEEVQEPIYEEVIEEASVAEEPVFVEEVQEPIYEKIIEEASVAEEPVFVEEAEVPVYETVEEEPVSLEESKEFIYNDMVQDKISSMETIVETNIDLRAHLRANIILSARMENILQELKGK